MKKRLDRQITIEQRSGAPDGFGQVQTTWATYAAPYAAVLHSRGSENLEDVLTYYDQPVTFLIRYDSGVNEKMRILHDNGRYYEIKSIEEIGRREMLKIVATWADTGGTL